MTTDEIMKLVDKICIESCKLGQIEFDTDMALFWLNEERSETRSAIETLVKEKEFLKKQVKELHKICTDNVISNITPEELKTKLQIHALVKENEELREQNKKLCVIVKCLKEKYGVGELIEFELPNLIQIDPPNLIKEYKELKQLNKDVFAAKRRYQIRLGEEIVKNEELLKENESLKAELEAQHSLYSKREADMVMELNNLKSDALILRVLGQGSVSSGLMPDMESFHKRQSDADQDTSQENTRKNFL